MSSALAQSNIIDVMSINACPEGICTISWRPNEKQAKQKVSEFIKKKILLKGGVKNNMSFYPHFVDKRFNPTPLSTLADLIIILYNLIIIHIG